MEIKVSKEIREYKERVFFGLSTRQFFCAIGAVGVAVGVYFLLQERLGQEAVSWLCILSAAPIAAAGFFRYNGMTLEKFALAWLQSQLLRAGRRLFKSVNYNDFAHNLKERREKGKHDVQQKKPRK